MMAIRRIAVRTKQKPSLIYLVAVLPCVKVAKWPSGEYNIAWQQHVSKMAKSTDIKTSAGVISGLARGAAAAKFCEKYL